MKDQNEFMGRDTSLMAMGLLTEVLDMEPSEFLAALRDKVGPGGLAEWHRLAAVLEEFGPMTDADGDDAGDL